MSYRATTVTMALVCAACGAPGEDDPLSARVHALRVPDCYQARVASSGLVSGGAGPSTGIANFSSGGTLSIPGRVPGLDGTRLLELERLLATAQRLLEPVMDDPGAGSWDWSDEDLRVQGESLARHEDSGRIALRLWSARHMRTADVEYSPVATVIALDEGRVVVNDDYLAVAEWERGCAPGGVNFEALSPFSLECWQRRDGRTLPALVCQQIVAQLRP